MKLSTNQIAGFLQRPPAGIRVILLYGPDAGLVRERADGLARQTVSDLNDPFRTASLTAASLHEDPARLYDEMASLPFGGGAKLIRVMAASDGMAGTVAKLLDDLPTTDSLLLLEAGELDKRSKLRAACEAAAGGAAVPCYIEEGPARQRIITDILQAAGATIQRDALSLLGDSLPPDRIAMRSELEKLALYAGAGKGAGKDATVTITIADVQAAVQDAGAAELDDLLNAVAGGQPKTAALLLDRLLEEQAAPVMLLRAAQRHFLRLQWARAQMDGGLSAGDAVKKLQPPVFWKQAEPLTNQLRRWSALRIEAALNRLFEAEAAVKRTGTPDTTLCAQLLLQMAA